MAGMLTQQVELSGERLEIGIVTHAKYIRETVALFDAPSGRLAARTRPAVAEPVMPGAVAAAATSATAMAVAR